MNATSGTPNTPADAARAATASPVLGLLALAVSLIAVALNYVDGLGAAALVAADLVLVAGMGTLLAVRTRTR
ncbi:hypothetical protein [Streptomyces sp. NPDC048340]|uniref:hypothetical protein n=1 Tax=Streptomyces sp. NPDC048340 TaxID=3365537 RepID=UPI0037225B9D